MFSDIFSQLLQERKLNAIEVSRALEIPKSIVYEWKNGQREPSAANLKKLSAYFGVSFASLLGICEPRSDDADDLVSDSSEKELILMLRAAKEISPSDHDKLVENMKQSLDLYLHARGKGPKDSSDGSM